MNFNAQRQPRVRSLTLIVAVMLFVPGLRLIARQDRKVHNSRKTTVHRRRRRHYVRYHHYRRHYFRVHMSRARVLQIQEALIKAGCLHEKADGIWGPTTSDAMRQYQQENGFAPTGLPEAKPLMKLGLGPHPLPPGLEPQPPAETGSQGETAEASADSSPSQAKKTSSSTQ